MTSRKIFICHRRGDAVRHAGMLLQNLRNSYGASTLHYGSHQSEEGKVLCKEGLHAMIEARAVLILIGPNWASHDNQERLHEIRGADPLRRWIALALTRHGAGGWEAPMLIPVLLDGASMPSRSSLPKDLKELPRLAALSFPRDEALWAMQYRQLLDNLNLALGIDSDTHSDWLTRLWKPLSLALTQLRRA